MVVEQHLAIASAGGHRTAAVVTNGDDGDQLACAAGSSTAQGNQLSAWAAREVLDVHPSEHSAVRASNSGTDGVYAVLVGPSVGVGVDRRTR